MTVREATSLLLKELEAIGWTVTRGRYPRAIYGARELRFRARSIIASPGEVSLPSAKWYVTGLHRLLYDSEHAWINQ